MNQQLIDEYRKLLNEVDAAVDRTLRRLSPVDVALAAKETIDDPIKAHIRCLTSPGNAEVGAALMAVSLIRVALRKAEAEEMEKGS